MIHPLVYFAWALSQGRGEHTKIGKTKYLRNRKGSLDTSYSEHGINFEYLIECETEEEEGEIEEYLHAYFDGYSTTKESNHTGGLEWFDKRFTFDEIKRALETGGYDNNVISDPNEIEKSLEEYKAVYEKEKKEKIDKIEKLKKIIQEKKEEREKKIKRDKHSIKDEIKWFEREYQRDIIKLGLDKLSELGKFYLELATGAGKTYIVFNIFKKIKPDILFCLSPRLKINAQNIGKKYLSILGEEYEAFNLSSDDNLDEFMKKDCKKVIIGCTSKGCDKIINIINTYSLNDSSLWIDECHWGIEGWITNGLSENQEYLLKSRNIKYRVYTSASPNTELIEKNEEIFGELFKEINVKELIQLKYLCNIKPFIFEINENSIDYCKTIIKDFTEYKRSWGLSFHNKCLNAFHIFLKHYEVYKTGETLIKPFLLIRENIKEILKTDEDKRCFENIDLAYDFSSFKKYESNINSIAYVVKKCDMGYDFNKIDYISLTDKKMSYSDLIQCIGRGLRSDCLGENGKNKEKELYLMIPNYIDEENAENFDNIINVIQYLQFDIGLEWEFIEKVVDGSSGSSRDGYSHEEYRGEKIIQSKIMDAMKLRKVEWNLKKLLVHCKNNNIHNLSDYINYRDKYPAHNLPEDVPTGINWCDTYRKHNYYNKNDCIEKIKKIMEENTALEFMEDHEELLEILTSNDSKIPNTCLWSFYGGSQSEYLVFN